MIQPCLTHLHAHLFVGGGCGIKQPDRPVPGVPAVRREIRAPAVRGAPGAPHVAPSASLRAFLFSERFSVSARPPPALMLPCPPRSDLRAARSWGWGIRIGHRSSTRASVCTWTQCEPRPRGTLVLGAPIRAVSRRAVSVSAVCNNPRCRARPQKQAGSSGRVWSAVRKRPPGDGIVSGDVVHAADMDCPLTRRH